jgi:hypothetical protein
MAIHYKEQLELEHENVTYKKFIFKDFGKFLFKDDESNCEHYVWTQLINSNWRWKPDCFPCLVEAQQYDHLLIYH